jgi:hypothetical protein
VQKAARMRGGSFPALRRMGPDCGLADLDTELEQFAVDARCTPEGLPELIRRIATLGLALAARCARRPGIFQPCVWAA